MVTVHHLNNSRSQRVLWLLEELGLVYQIKHYERDPNTMLAPASLKKVHPLGKSPVISDGDQVMAESGAILEYLLETHGAGRLQPAAKSSDYWRFKYWLHYAEGSAMSPLLLSLIFAKVKKAPMPFFVKPIANGIANTVLKTFVNPQIKLHLDYMESELGKTLWFAGSEFTAADIQMSFPIEAAQARGGLDSKYPNLMSFIERIHARPAYKRALAKGGPYNLLS